MNASPDHPDFTAIALGEHINGTPARAVIDALRTSVAARREADSIRDTADALRLALKQESSLKLDDARRLAICSADPAELRARFALEQRAAAAIEPVAAAPRYSLRRFYPAAAVAVIAIAALAVLRVLPGLRLPSRDQSIPVAGSPNGSSPSGQINVTPGSTVSSAVPPRRTPLVTPLPDSSRPPLPPNIHRPAAPAPQDALTADAPLPPGATPAQSAPPPDPKNFDFATPIVPKRK